MQGERDRQPGQMGGDRPYPSAGALLGGVCTCRQRLVTHGRCCCAAGWCKSITPTHPLLHEGADPVFCVCFCGCRQTSFSRNEPRLAASVTCCCPSSQQLVLGRPWSCGAVASGEVMRCLVVPSSGSMCSACGHTCMAYLLLAAGVGAEFAMSHSSCQEVCLHSCRQFMRGLGLRTQAWAACALHVCAEAPASTSLKRRRQPGNVRSDEEEDAAGGLQQQQRQLYQGL